jgi:hypothetical protein
LRRKDGQIACPPFDHVGKTDFVIVGERCAIGGDEVRENSNVVTLKYPNLA